MIVYLPLLSKANIQITPINNENGYSVLKIFDTEIVNETKIVLHIIRPIEINHIIDDLEQNTIGLKSDYRSIIQSEIITLRTKLRSIMPLSNRQKRGLLNIVGSAGKWLFGVMDDEDRQNIIGQLDIANGNSHNIIETVNQQVIINNHFNDSINLIRSSILDDRKKIDLAMNNIQTQNSEIRSQLLFNDQLMKLKFLENKINQILDNISSAKYNIFHPSILTSEEIDKYNIDFYKLKLIRMGILLYNNDCLIFSIKIPVNFIKVEVRLILPMPNNMYYEIEEKQEMIVNIDNNTYAYSTNKMLKELKLTKNCVFKDNCKLIFNNKTSFELMDDETVIVKNAVNMKIDNNCNANTSSVIYGNNIVMFSNCKITIQNEIFYNQKESYLEKIPDFTDYNKNNFTSKLTFNDIVLSNFKNIKDINELKNHQQISYSLIVFIFISTVISLTIICYIFKAKSVNIEINERIQENSGTNGGGVTYPYPTVSYATEINEIVNRYI